MTELDVIILTNTADQGIYQMTENAIESLKESEEPGKFNIIIVESNKRSTYEYNVDHQIHPSEDFNYNTYLNIGSKYCVSEYSAVSNNDVLFRKNWWTKMKQAFIDHNLDTASPKSPTEQFGIVQRVEMKHRYTPITKVVEG